MRSIVEQPLEHRIEDKRVCQPGRLAGDNRRPCLGLHGQDHRPNSTEHRRTGSADPCERMDGRDHDRGVQSSTNTLFPTTTAFNAPNVDRFTLDKGYVTIGDVQQFPLYSRVGLDYLPFGLSTGVRRTTCCRS